MQYFFHPVQLIQYEQLSPTATEQRTQARNSSAIRRQPRTAPLTVNRLWLTLGPLKNAFSLNTQMSFISFCFQRIM